MALDRLIKIDGGGISTTSDYRVGVITASKFIGPFDGTAGNFSGIITASGANFSGNVTIGGTLTYEDVTNIDSVGIITGKGADINGDLDVDGHTNLDNVSIAGMTTMSGNLRLESTYPRIYLKDTNNNPDFSIINNDGNLGFYDDTNTEYRLQVLGTGETRVYHNLIVDKDLDVDGHTNLDNVSVAGVTTFAGAITAPDVITAGALLHEGDTNTLVHFSAEDTIELKTHGFSRLSVTNNGVALTGGYLNSNGNRIILGDSSGANDDRLVLGNNNDLQLFHDASDSHIVNATGVFYIQNTGDLRIRVDDTDAAIHCVRNGAVELYHNNIKRLETSSVGVSIPQDLDVDGHTNLDNVSIAGVTTAAGNITISSSHPKLLLTDDSNPDFSVHVNDSAFHIRNETVNRNDFRITSDGTNELYYSGNKKLNTTNTGIDVTGSVVADDLIVTGTSVVADLKSTNNNYVLGLAGNNSSDKAYLGTDSSGNFLLATGSGVVERLRIDSSGNIGVGIAPSSGARLWIATNDNPFVGTRYNAGADGAVLFLQHSRSNTIGTNAALSNNDEVGTIQFRAYASNNSSVKVAALIKAEVNGTTGSGGVPTDLLFGTGTTSDNATERLRITKEGKLLVGATAATSNGIAEFHRQVNGGAQGCHILIKNTSTDSVNNTARLKLETSGGTAEFFAFAAAETYLRSRTGGAANLLLLADGASKIRMFTNGNERVQITSDGNLAINKTANINAKLHIGDTGNDGALSQLVKLANDSSGSGTGAQINMGGAIANESTSASIGGFYDGTGTSFIVKTAGTYANQSTVGERFRITSSGNVGIGEDNPDQKLHVYEQSGSSQAYIHVQNNRARNAAIKFTTTQGSWLVGQGIGVDTDRFSIYDTQERFIINSSGDVGIGQLAPAGKLHISSGTSGDCKLIIEADTDNNAEGDNPQIEFRQDGGVAVSAIGHGLLSAQQNGLVLANGVSNGYISFATNAGADGHVNATERFRITPKGDVCVNNMAYNTYETAGTNINTMVDNNEKRSGVYWINYGGEIFRAYIKANWCEDRNWILAAKFFDMQDMPSGSSLWTNDTWVNESDFNLYGGIFSKYPAWRYFPFDRLAMQMGNRIPPIMRFSSNQTLYGAFSGGRASNGGGVTASSTYPAMSGNTVTYHSMSNFMGPDFYDVGGSEDRMQSYGLNKWANNSTNSTSGQNRGSEHVHAGSRQDGGSLQYASLKGWGLTVEDSHPTINGIDSIAVAGAWIGCPLDEGGSTQGNNSSNAGADSGFGFGFCTGNPGRTGTAGYAEWGRGTECVNTLPAYIWLSAD